MLIRFYFQCTLTTMVWVNGTLRSQSISGRGLCSLELPFLFPIWSLHSMVNADLLFSSRRRRGGWTLDNIHKLQAVVEVLCGIWIDYEVSIKYLGAPFKTGIGQVWTFSFLQLFFHLRLCKQKIEEVQKNGKEYFWCDICKLIRQCMKVIFTSYFWNVWKWYLQICEIS